MLANLCQQKYPTNTYPCYNKLNNLDRAEGYNFYYVCCPPLLIKEQLPLYVHVTFGQWEVVSFTQKIDLRK